MYRNVTGRPTSSRGRGGGREGARPTRPSRRPPPFSSSSSSPSTSTRRMSESTWRGILDQGERDDDDDDDDDDGEDQRPRRVSPGILKHGPPPSPTPQDTYPTKWKKLILLEFHDALAEFQRRINDAAFDWEDASPVYVKSRGINTSTGLEEVTLSNEPVGGVVGSGTVTTTTTTSSGTPPAVVAPTDLTRTLLKLKSGGWLYIVRLTVQMVESEGVDEWPVNAMAVVYDNGFERVSSVPVVGRAVLFESFTTLIYRFQSLSKYPRAVDPTLRTAIETGRLPTSEAAVLLPVAHDARQSSQLNDTQWRILTHVTSPVDFVQGPPGTGKSTFIVELVKTRVPPHQGRVLLCTTTNKAIDSLTEKLAASGFANRMLAFGNATRLGTVSKQFLLPARVTTHPTTVQVVTGILDNATHRQLPVTLTSVELYLQVYKQRKEVYAESPTSDARDNVKEAKSKLLNALSELKRLAKAIRHYVDATASHPLVPVSVVDALESGRCAMVEAASGSSLLDACTRYAATITDAKKQITLAVTLSVISTAKYIVCTAATAATIPGRMKRESDACEAALRQRDATTATDKLAVVLAALGLADDAGRKTKKYTFEYVILDESGAMLEPDVIATVIHGCRSLLLVGDHRQLPPFTKWRGASAFKYDVSLLQRLSDHAAKHRHLMTTQYRMPSPLATLVSTQFYDGKLDTAAALNATRVRARPVVFVNVNGQEEPRGTSFVNAAEVNAIVEIVDRERATDPQQVVNVICFHKPQFAAVRRALSQRRLLQDGTPSRHKSNHTAQPQVQVLDVCTVDSMQGREADVVILSCVRTGARLGFLTNRNRINVALSRAKHVLFIVGHERALTKDTTWRRVIQHNSVSRG